MPRALPPLLLLLLIAAWPRAASAQAVYRCVDAQGRSVFSDQPCHAQDARPREAPRPRPEASASGFASGTGSTVDGCARTPERLLEGVRGALEAGDVNRLATHYHWAGTSARAGRMLMDELEAIAARRLVALELRFPAVAPPVPEPPLPVDDGAAPAATPAPAPPTGLHVEQQAGPGDPGARTVDFRLVRHAGCWWVEL